MGKQNLYDCSIRMPLLIAGPGIQPGKRVDQLVYQHSMYATTCELAGIPVPSSVQFPSLAPLLRGSEEALHDAVFCYYRGFQRMARTRTHKLIVYPQANRVQLFDIEHDPWEMNDLSNDPAFAGVKTDLMKKLKQLQQTLNDPLVVTI
jgi:choline-sulfatase